MSAAMTQERHDRLVYAFGHLVASRETRDAHHADSGDLADDVLLELGMVGQVREVIEVLAEHVAFNFEYHGEGEADRRRIEGGEL